MTRRGYLYSKWAIGGGRSRCVTVSLLDSEGTWAGVLRLNKGWGDDSSSEHSDKDDADELDSTSMDLLEFIELSKGEVQNQVTEDVSFNEWYCPQCPTHSGLYKFYNVMCIEWQDGIAYRKAVGRVIDHVWERVATEVVNFTLG